MYKYHSLRFMADKMCDDENVKKEKKDRKKTLPINKTMLVSTDRSKNDHGSSSIKAAAPFQKYREN